MKEADTLEKRLVDVWDMANKAFDAAAKAVDKVQRKPKWVANELRRRADEMVREADRIKAWAIGRPERAVYLCAQFEEGARTAAGGLKITATGIEKQDAFMIEGAKAIHGKGMAQAFAAKEAALR